MATIHLTSMSFGELREVLSALETAEREAGRFSPVVRETLVDPFVAAAKDKGVDVAEFPRLIGRTPIANPPRLASATPPNEPSNGKTGTHPFSARSGRNRKPKANPA